MSQFKINILFKFVEGPWGGGNQFLKVLRKKFVAMGVYEENPADADVLLFNSYPFNNEYLFREAYKLKKLGKVLVHRVDGPTIYVRGEDVEIDRILFCFNQYFADGTIFQSSWSRQKCYLTGIKKKPYEVVIRNAPDEKIFHPKAKTNNSKIKIIAASWSSNMRKGFEVYKYLDENLDFNRYEMTFAGNSPISFDNIRCVGSLLSIPLGDELRSHDIFITASINDPCSNSLIEALHCGLPSAVLNSGGHPEIAGKGGEVFNGKTDVLPVIDKLACEIEKYREEISLPDMNQVAKRYYGFCEKVFIATNKKKTSYFNYLNIMKKVYQWKCTKTLRHRLPGKAQNVNRMA